MLIDVSLRRIGHNLHAVNRTCVSSRLRLKQRPSCDQRYAVGCFKWQQSRQFVSYWRNAFKGTEKIAEVKKNPSPGQEDEVQQEKKIAEVKRDPNPGQEDEVQQEKKIEEVDQKNPAAIKIHDSSPDMPEISRDSGHPTPSDMELFRFELEPTAKSPKENLSKTQAMASTVYQENGLTSSIISEVRNAEFTMSTRSSSSETPAVDMTPTPHQKEQQSLSVPKTSSSLEPELSSVHGISEYIESSDSNVPTEGGQATRTDRPLYLSATTESHSSAETTIGQYPTTETSGGPAPEKFDKTSLPDRETQERRDGTLDRAQNINGVHNDAIPIFQFSFPVFQVWAIGLWSWDDLLFKFPYDAMHRHDALALFLYLKNDEATSPQLTTGSRKAWEASLKLLWKVWHSRTIQDFVCRFGKGSVVNTMYLLWASNAFNDPERPRSLFLGVADPVVSPVNATVLQSSIPTVDDTTLRVSPRAATWQNIDMLQSSVLLCPDDAFQLYYFFHEKVWENFPKLIRTNRYSSVLHGATLLFNMYSNTRELQGLRSRRSDNQIIKSLARLIMLEAFAGTHEVEALFPGMGSYSQQSKPASEGQGSDTRQVPHTDSPRWHHYTKSDVTVLNSHDANTVYTIFKHKPLGLNTTLGKLVERHQSHPDLRSLLSRVTRESVVSTLRTLQRLVIWQCPERMPDLFSGLSSNATPIPPHKYKLGRMVHKNKKSGIVEYATIMQEPSGVGSKVATFSEPDSEATVPLSTAVPSTPVDGNTQDLGQLAVPVEDRPTAMTRNEHMLLEGERQDGVPLDITSKELDITSKEFAVWIEDENGLEEWKTLVKSMSPRSALANACRCLKDFISTLLCTEVRTAQQASRLLSKQDPKVREANPKLERAVANYCTAANMVLLIESTKTTADLEVKVLPPNLREPAKNNQTALMEIELTSMERHKVRLLRNLKNSKKNMDKKLTVGRSSPGVHTSMSNLARLQRNVRHWNQWVNRVQVKIDELKARIAAGSRTGGDTSRSEAEDAYDVDTNAETPSFQSHSRQTISIRYDALHKLFQWILDHFRRLCYEHGSRNFPQVMREKGWTYPEAMPIEIFAREITDSKSLLYNGLSVPEAHTLCKHFIPYTEQLRSLCHVRNVYSHSNPIDTTNVILLIQNLIELTKAFNATAIRGELRDVLYLIRKYELEQRRQVEQSHATFTAKLDKINAQRSELNRWEAQVRREFEDDTFRSQHELGRGIKDHVWALQDEVRRDHYPNGLGSYFEEGESPHADGRTGQSPKLNVWPVADDFPGESEPFPAKPSDPSATAPDVSSFPFTLDSRFPPSKVQKGLKEQGKKSSQPEPCNDDQSEVSPNSSTRPNYPLHSSSCLATVKATRKPDQENGSSRYSNLGFLLQSHKSKPLIRESLIPLQPTENPIRHMIKTQRHSPFVGSVPSSHRDRFTTSVPQLDTSTKRIPTQKTYKGGRARTYRMPNYAGSIPTPYTPDKHDPASTKATGPRRVLSKTPPKREGRRGPRRVPIA
ncbi:hypothetical protein K504DRAFT_537624 [Pleomassaria siparia CBS 279.74]|uniref:Uncharacterized protein n=1 Tax=Pleomassaria siparia CBS 279.74 TaxID=1314801 RepID=A0A6G1JX64_9PLEO|nr:hypothetical protein K504DRAFT_537624 [Pleomassaria siparia CBS 279.74]